MMNLTSEQLEKDTDELYTLYDVCETYAQRDALNHAITMMQDKKVRVQNQELKEASAVHCYLTYIGDDSDMRFKFGQTYLSNLYHASLKGFIEVELEIDKETTERVFYENKENFFHTWEVVEDYKEAIIKLFDMGF